MDTCEEMTKTKDGGDVECGRTIFVPDRLYFAPINRCPDHHPDYK